MGLAYQCLILDHDDTIVDSTADIHYPAYREVMRILRPDLPILKLNEFFHKHINPGFLGYLQDELKLTPDEMRIEFNLWQKFTRKRIPPIYPDMLAFLKQYHEQGGIIAVSSHSEVEIIERDFQANDDHFKPDLIFGWDESESRRKPDPYPVKETAKHFNLKPEQILVVDDLKWGMLMGKAAGIATAAAGWGHQVPAVESYMRENCDYYFGTIAELKSFMLR